ncbi:MAG: alpha/beta hydrolase [Parachlamydiaceae bacterium]|nr:alpha/beta hydrolase [Parachlamydiaceae bacterium]
MANQAQIAKTNEIETWYETFGEKENPALLLAMGGLCQGILWPKEFCEQLAEQGFFVIRYDYRDSGLSTCFDYTSHPYDLLDMAKDAIGLLDFLKIKTANVCGLSMGGPVAELMAVHFPDRVHSLTLIATSCDLRPSSLAYDKQSSNETSLPRPTENYLKWMHRFLQKVPQNESEKLDQRVECWSILNGSVAPFEEERYRELHAEFLRRLRHPESLTNHLEAIKSSFQMIVDVPFHVTVPTVVIHGTEDPILQPIHGETLAKSISGAKFVLVEGFGHVPNRLFYPIFIKEITEIAHTRKLQS